MRIRMASHMSHPNCTLSVTAGDFRWVASPKDRISKDCALESRSNGAAEEQHWKHTVANPFETQELEQLYQPILTLLTHNSALARSTLDSVYWNQHLAEQLDRRLVCGALEATQLSAHRAISFARRLPQQKDPLSRPIQLRAVHHTDWKPRVCARFQSLLSHANPQGSGLLRLSVLKSAIRHVSDEIALEPQEPKQDSHEQEDALGWIMRFIRAAEGNHLGVMRQAPVAYPKVYKLSADPLDKHLPHNWGLRPFWDHAVTLAQEQATRQLQELHRGTSPIFTLRKPKLARAIMQLLRSIAPGRPTHLQAIRTADGSISADPQVMANTLKDHWPGVCSSRHMHETLFTKRIQEDLTPDEGPLPKSALPPHDHGCWLVTKEDIQPATDRSPISSPGPDGIPCLAWRKLSNVAVKILFKACRSLSSDKGASLLSEGYPSFHSSDMVFLQKYITGVDETHGSFCAPEDTRPLNVTNSDNRLLANAVRLRIAPLLEKWVSPFLRGFSLGDLCSPISLVLTKP